MPLLYCCTWINSFSFTYCPKFKLNAFIFILSCPLRLVLPREMNCKGVITIHPKWNWEYAKGFLVIILGLGGKCWGNWLPDSGASTANNDQVGTPTVWD